MELQGELQEGVVRVVAGIGVNVHMDRADDVDQPWSSLARQCPDESWERNQIASALIRSLLESSAVFSEKGFKAFRDSWQSRDLFRDQYVVARGGEVSGVGYGIDDQGNYLVRAKGEDIAIRAGEVSLRVVQ